MSVNERFKSNRVADKALRQISVNLVQQLNLFETTLRLHAIDGLTLLETQKLQSSQETEIERKQYTL